MSSGNSNQDQQPPTLRDYQLEAVQTFKNAINYGYTRIALSAPTGSGKTVIFAAIIRDILQQHPGGKVLVIVDSKELAVQAERKIRAAFPGDLSVGHIRKDLPDAANRVLIAMRQTLGRERKLAEFKQTFSIADFNLVVVDEAHHSPANSYLRILSEVNDGVEIEHLRVDHRRPTHGHSTPILGVSATLARNDQRALEWVYEDCMETCSRDDLVQHGQAAPLSFWKLSTTSPVLKAPFWQQFRGPRGSGVAQSAPDDPLARYQAEVSRFNSEVHRHYADQAAGRRSTIVFCATIDLAHDAALVFSSLVVESRALSSRTSEAEQMEIIRLFRVGELRMLAVCMMLIEGFDLPQIDCIVLARPTYSNVLYNQMLGRGTRTSPQTGKTDCLVIDLVGNSDRHAEGVKPMLSRKYLE